jgi:hypothetical protein
MKKIKFYNKDTLRWENIDSKIISSSDKYQIYQKLDNYLPKSFAIKRIDLKKFSDNCGYKLSLYSNYNNKSLLTYDVLLPRYIENNDLKNSLAFIDYSKSSSDLSHSSYYENRTLQISNINFDGKEYESLSRNQSSSGNILDYTKEKIENNKHITYYYICLARQNDGSDIIIDKFARIEIQQYLIENVDETYTLRVELIPKVFIYNGTNVTINSLDVDFDKINDDDFYEYKGNSTITINYYGTGYDTTNLTILTDNIDEIANKKNNNDYNYIKVSYNRDTPIVLNFDNENTIDLSNEKGLIDNKEINLETFLENNSFGVEINYSDDSLIYNNTDAQFTQKFDNIVSFFKDNYLYLCFKIKGTEEIKLCRIELISIQNGAETTIKLGKIEECKHKCVNQTPYEGNNDKILIYYLFTDKNFKRLEYTDYEKSNFVKLIKKGQISLNGIVFKLNAVDYFKKINKNNGNTENFVTNNYDKELTLNNNVKIKGTLQKDNSAIGDPDEDYITSKYFGEQFPIQFMTQMAMITGGSVNNLVLKNQSYTSPAYTFTDKTNIVSLGITDLNKQFNNFVLTFTDTPNKLIIDTPAIGQSGIIKVIGAKKINGYDSNIKSTITLPVLDKLNDTEYFSYYVFSESEILLSRI